MEVWPRVYCRPVQRGEFLPPETVEVSSEKLGCEVNFSLKFPSEKGSPKLHWAPLSGSCCVPG